MVFRFELPDDGIDDNVRRAAKAEFDRAIAEVSETGFEIHGTIRNVRRRLKRVRAILRLIRPAFPDFATENAALRDIGAEFSELRDAMALVEAIDLLARDAGGAADLPLMRTRKALAARAAEREAMLDRETLLTALRARLRDARVRSELWEFDGAGSRALVPGFAETYRRARSGLKRAEAHRHEEQFHEWRKAVKHHAAQLSLLTGLMPQFVDARRRRAKKLATLLGDLQNLSVLRAALSADSGGDDADNRVVEDLAQDKIAKLCGRALKLGRPLLAEKPSAVRARWQTYLKDWRAARILA